MGAEVATDGGGGLGGMKVTELLLVATLLTLVIDQLLLLLSKTKNEIKRNKIFCIASKYNFIVGIYRCLEWHRCCC